MISPTILIIILAIIVLVLGGALWVLKTRPAGSTRPGDDQNREHVQYTMQDMLKTRPEPIDFDKENPAYLAMTPEEYEAFSRQFTETITSIGEGYHAAAYHKLEGFIDKASKADRETIAKGLALCIRAMCMDKRPAAVLELYDKLKAEGPGIELIHAAGLDPELSEILMAALERESRDFTWTQASAAKRCAFFKQKHPLMEGLMHDCRSRVVHELNYTGRDAYRGRWQDCEETGPALRALEKEK